MSKVENSTILIVNDAEGVLELMTLQLHQAGYQSLTATNGREGFEIARRQHPDIVISDVAMPEVSGIELCRMIRAEDGLRTVPILLVSATHKEDAKVVEALKAGADDYLEVPYNKARLIAKVARLLERKRAEGALKFQAHLLDTVEQAVIATDLDGKISYWNRFAEKLYGWSAVEAIGGNVIDLIPAQTTVEQASEIMSHLRGGESWSGEFNVRRKDGTTFPAIVTDSPIYDDKGTLVGIVGVSFDITKRKRAEETLRESKERYRTLFNSIDEGFCTIEVLFDGNDKPIDYRFLEVNPSFAKQTGIKDARGRRMREIAPQHEEYWFEIYGKIALTGEHARFENLAAQLHRWYDVYAFRVGEPQERKVAILFNDITARKWAEESLRRANEELERRVEQRTHELTTANALLKKEVAERTLAGQALRENHILLQGVIEGTPDCIFAKDLNGRYLMVNSAYANFIGKHAEEIVGKDDTELFPPEIAQSLIEHDHQVLISDGALTLDEVLLAEGMQRTAHVIKNVYRNDKGEAIGLIGIARDITERKHAEDKIRESERQLAIAQQIAHLGSWEWDIATNKVSWSDELYRIAGQTPQQFGVSYEGYLEQVHPNDRKVVNGIIEKALRTHKPFEFEHRIVRPDGEVRTLRCQGEIVTNESGHAAKMYGIAGDITERKRAEEALKQSEQDYRGLFEQAHDAIVIFAHEREIVLDVNERACEMYGFSRSEFIGMSLEMISKDVARGKAQIAETLEKGDYLNFETVQYRKDGSEILLEINSSIVLYQGQRAILSINRDITERKQMEEVLRESEERFRLMVEGVTDYAIFSLDIDGRIASWNEGATRLNGYHQDEIIGQHFSVCCIPEDCAQGRPEQALKIAATEDRYEDECWVVRKDGSRFWANIIITALRDEDGGLRGFVEITRDITERKRAEEALREQREFLRQITDANPHALFVKDGEERFVFANEAMAKVYGTTVENLIGKTETDFPLDEEAVERFHLQNREVRETGRKLFIPEELVADQRTGEVRWFETIKLPLFAPDGTVDQVLGVATEITERVRAREERMQLQLRLLAAQEEERQRISRELHDQMGQHLPALMLGLKALKDSGQYRTPPVDRLQQLQDLAERIARDAHALAKDLRPALLNGFGLHTALSNYLDEWSERCGISVDFHSTDFDEDERLPEHIEITLYRTVQEALTNVIKHAQAEHVSLILERSRESVLAVVEDDGKGFNVEAVLGMPISERRLGLLGMQERVELVGGTLAIESAQGAGTTVAARIPTLMR